MLELGNWRIRSIITGHVRLDGGAMFGVVPRPLWSRSKPPDERNRILLATRTLMALNPGCGRIVLVDTGPGSKWTPQDAERYGVESRDGAVEEALREAGASPRDVTDVIVTHLHFDHAGGMTEWEDAAAGRARLLYPNATHWVHQRHWEHAGAPSDRDRVSFVAADFRPLEEAGVLRRISGEPPDDVLEDMRWLISDGHTPAQLLPIFETSGGPDLLFVGDLVPTAAHLPPAWVMGYDLFPLTTLAERKAVYERCRADGLLLAFPHETEAGIVSLDFDNRGKPSIREVLG